MTKIYTNATLHLFKMPLVEDIVGYTSAEVLYKKPDGTTGTITPDAVYEDPARVDWKPGANFLDQHGTWKFQVKVYHPSGDIYGEKVEYEIYEPIS